MKTQEKAPTKHQLKSEATRKALLEAAEEIFARDGYERAQIDEIAKLSGRTRGAVYSQYKTKEQLFFALQERRTQRASDKMRAAIATHPTDTGQSFADLKALYADLGDSKTDILDLELKLYAVRNPECREEWRKHYINMYSSKNVHEFEEAFGVSEEPGRSRLSSRILALAALKSGLMLTMQFMPKELSESETKTLLKEIFDGLFPATVTIAASAGTPVQTKAVAPTKSASKKFSNTAKKASAKKR